VLVEGFEDANYALEGSTSDSRLRSLMEEHGLRQRDMLAIGKEQAKKLAELFQVPADLFL